MGTQGLGSWSGMLKFFNHAQGLWFTRTRGTALGSGGDRSQLHGLAGEALEVVTTNGTALQPGFYLFLRFVLASLVLSHLLANRVVEAGGPPQSVT